MNLMIHIEPLHPLRFIGPGITTQVVNKSTTQDPKESDINVIKGQL